MSQICTYNSLNGSCILGGVYLHTNESRRETKTRTYKAELAITEGEVGAAMYSVLARFAVDIKGVSVQRARTK